MKKVLYLLYKMKIWLLSRFYILWPEKGTYQGFHRYQDVFGAAKYLAVRRRIFDRVERRIQKKEHQTIRIIMAFCAEWNATEIYHYFDKKGMDIAVVLTPYFNSTEENIRKEYARNREFCKEKGFRYLDVFDEKTLQFKGNLRDVQGDVVIYMKPWMAHYAEQTSLYHMPLSSISCYITYGFLIEKGESFQFNQWCHSMFTHIYCESEMHRQLYAEYCAIGDSHVEFSGYPKADFFYKENDVDASKIWKGIADKPQMLKIIYSPHWQFGDGYATFRDNGLQILEYAEAHPDTTSWVYKPHPHLETEVVARGYMNAGEYRDYVERWRKLPNARVYLSGDYADIFMTSDCIINDSISFVAEYMYTHKPMLLLRNKNGGYNAFGQEAVRHVYTCRGDDIDAIFRFIENVRCGRDDMKEDRERFFHETLDYYHIKGQLASEYIISRIADTLGTR